uniref:Uncharacterized protein LOC114330159 isoform X2 n=1 Tax=Diabrotica virgifera virgifera TaxID=50390 RepID=A0A6P7FGV6_DIAVI
MKYIEFMVLGDEVTISSPPLQPPPPAPPIEEGDEAINENGEIPEEGEVEAEDGEEVPEDAAALGGFAMALSRDQQNQYGSQFNSRSSGAPNAVPTIDVPTVEIVDEV